MDDYDKLAVAKDRSLTAISPDMDWQRLDEKKQSTVHLSTSYDFMDKTTRAEQFKWLREYTEKFAEFFKPLIKVL